LRKLGKRGGTGKKEQVAEGTETDDISGEGGKRKTRNLKNEQEMEENKQARLTAESQKRKGAKTRKIKRGRMGKRK